MDNYKNKVTVQYLHSYKISNCEDTEQLQI